MKLKYSFIHNLSNLTDCEMNLILYLVKRQNEATGYVEGVYYRDVIKWTDMCKQSFYNAREGLISKGILTIKHRGDKDCDVQIVGNSFPVKATPKDTYAEGYVKLSRPVFRSQAFKDLKAHEKYMLFEFLKSTHEDGSSMWRDIKPFLKKFEELFRVTSRVVKGYLHSLKRFFSIGIKNGQYIITYLHSVFRDERGQRSEERQYLDHLVKKECWRNCIQISDQDVFDTADLVTQYRQQLGGTEAAIEMVMSCIRSSVSGIERKARQLNPKYIHKLIQDSMIALADK